MRLAHVMEQMWVLERAKMKEMLSEIVMDFAWDLLSGF